MGDLVHASQRLPAIATFNPTPTTDQLHADLQQTLFDFAEYKLKACALLTRDVDARLLTGDGPGARQAFRNAENAFESVQRCIVRMEREEWRTETETRLKDLGLILDGLWVKLVSGGFPVL
jgi:hypothetical protein